MKFFFHTNYSGVNYHMYVVLRWSQICAFSQFYSKMSVDLLDPNQEPRLSVVTSTRLSLPHVSGLCYETGHVSDSVSDYVSALPFQSRVVVAPTRKSINCGKVLGNNIRPQQYLDFVGTLLKLKNHQSLNNLTNASETIQKYDALVKSNVHLADANLLQDLIDEVIVHRLDMELTVDDVCDRVRDIEQLIDHTPTTVAVDPDVLSEAVYNLKPHVKKLEGVVHKVQTNYFTICKIVTLAEMPDEVDEAERIAKVSKMLTPLARSNRIKSLANATNVMGEMVAGLFDFDNSHNIIINCIFYAQFLFAAEYAYNTLKAKYDSLVAMCLDDVDDSEMSVVSEYYSEELDVEIAELTEGIAFMVVDHVAFATAVPAVERHLKRSSEPTELTEPGEPTGATKRHRSA